MSLVPLLYFSRGQLESVDWPEASLSLAARSFANGEDRASRYDQAFKERIALSNLIAKEID